MLHELLSAARALLLGALLLCAAATVSAVDPYDDVQLRAEEGRLFGRDLNRQVTLPAVDDEGNVTLPVAGQVRAKDLVPGADRGDVAEISALAGDLEAIKRAGAEKRAELDVATTADAEAYRALRAAPSAQTATIEADTPLWQATAAALAPTNLGAVYGACQNETSYETVQGDPAYTQVERTCERINIPGSCARSRTLQTEQLSGATVFELNEPAVTANIDVAIALRDRLPAGTLINGAALQVQWTGTVANVLVVEAPAASNDWQGLVRIVHDPTHLVCTLPDGSSCSAGTPQCTCVGPPQNVALRVTADVTGARETIDVAPEDCPGESDGFCQARWTCTSTEAPLLGGEPLSDALLAQLTPLYSDNPLNSPPSATAPMCWSATADYDCEFHLGAMDCWTTPGGQTQCHENTEANTQLDTCGALRLDRDCALARTQCAEGGAGASAFCYVSTDVYQCRTAVPTTVPIAVSHSACDGALRCVGDDCIKPDHALEQPRDFQKAQAALAVQQHLLTDVHQDQPNGPVRVLPGQPLECRKGLGSSMSCCTETASDADAQWYPRYARNARRANAAGVAERARQDGEPQRGAWTDVRSGQVTREILAKNVTSLVENVDGGEAGAIPSDGTTMEAMNEQYLEETEDASLSGGDWMCTTAEWELAHRKELGQCLHIGSYCRSTVLGQCIDKRDSYCCFSSALSKATREHLALPDGIAQGAFGTPRHPRCEGLDPNAVAVEKLRTLPLDEWVGHMQKGGAFPPAGATTETEQRYSLERLTGSGSALANDGVRRNTLERTLARFDAHEVDEARATLKTSYDAERPAAIEDPDAAGEIGFAPAFAFTPAGRPGAVYLRRIGKRGAAEVTVSTRDDTARAGVHYTALSRILRWADGEDGLRSLTVPTHVPHDATGPLTLHLVIDQSAGAARGSHDRGTLEIRYADAPATPPPPSGALRVRKTVDGWGATLMPPGTAFRFRIVAINGTESAIPEVTLLDAIQAPLSVADILSALCHAGGVTSPAELQSEPTPRFVCRTLNLPPQGVLEMTLRVRGQPIGEYPNGCDVLADVPARDVMCAAVARVGTNQGGTGGSPPGCPAPPAGFVRDMRFQRFTDVRTLNWANVFLRDFPNTGGPLGLLNMDYGRYAAIQFTAPLDPELYVGLSHVVHWYEAQIGGEASVYGIYSSLSPCPGDFRIARSDNAPLNDPTLRNACRNVAFNEVGVRTQTLLGIGYTIAGEPNKCPIEPGRTYYWNFILANPDDGFDLATDNPCSFASPDRCGIQFSFD